MKVTLLAHTKAGATLQLMKASGRGFADAAKKAQDYIFNLSQDSLVGINHFVLEDTKTGKVLGRWWQHDKESIKKFAFIFGETA